MKNLYRGKRVDIDVWIVGYLVKTKEHTYIFIPESYDDDLFLSPKSVFIEVIPETVGVYTQLNDKNGNEVFTGDILRMGFDDYCVKYNPEQACYTFYLIKSNEEVVHWGFNQSTVANLEITGNIIDTPELLKG